MKWCEGYHCMAAQFIRNLRWTQTFGMVFVSDWPRYFTCLGRETLRFCSPSHVFLGVGRVASRQIFTPIKTTTKEVLVGQMMSRPNHYGIWTRHDTFLELWWLWTTRVLWGSSGTFRLPQPPTGVYQYDQLNTTEVLIWLQWCLPAGSGQLWNNRGE